MNVSFAQRCLFRGQVVLLSGDTDLAAAITHVNVFTHMKHLLWTTFPSLLVAAIVMFVAGRGVQSTGGRGFDKVAEMNNTLSQAFTWNVVMLLIPLLIILIGSAWKKPTIPVMLLSSAVAMFNAVVIRHLYAPQGLQLGPGSQGHHQSAEPGWHGEHDEHSPDCILCPVLRGGAFGLRGFEQDRGVSAQDQQEHRLIVVTLLTGILTNIHHLQRPGLPPAAWRAAEARILAILGEA